MSVWSQSMVRLHLRCDGEGCTKAFHPHRIIEQQLPLLKLAARQGWLRVDGNDYCSRECADRTALPRKKGETSSGT